MGDYIKVGSSSGSGGSTTFDGLTDKATVDLPSINTPLVNALSGKEVTANKKTDVDANKTSNTFFPTVKAVFDWVSGLFVKGAASSTDNALVRWDGATGKAVQNSKILVADSGALTVASATQTFFDASREGDGNLEFKLVNNNPTRYTALNFGEVYGSKQGTMYYIGSGYPTSTPRYQANSLTLEVLTANGKLNLIYPSTGSLNIYNSNDALIAKINNLGNIGINTDAPTAKLDVNGTSRFRSGAAFNGQIIDNVGSSGADDQVLKKVGGLVLWSNP